MAKAYKELTIKFSGTAPSLSALPEHPFVNALVADGGDWARVETVYFDTMQGDLAAAGLRLSRRQARAERLQIVKRASMNGGVARRRWDCALAGQDAFPAPTGCSDVDRTVAAAAATLRPVARKDADRWAAEFRFRDSVVALAADLGAVRIVAAPEGGCQTPLAEARVKLVSGAPADLFAMAKLLLANLPLRLRAASALDFAPPVAAAAGLAASKRKPLQASPNDAAGDILQRALVAIAERVIAAQPAILEARSPEGVRQMRVELRRLRATERAFRRALAGTQLRGLAVRARAIARGLGPARDWDVFIDQTLPAAAQDGYAVEGFARLTAQAGRKRAQCWAAAVAHVASAEFSSFALDLLETAHLQPWRRGGALDKPAGAFAKKTLNKALRKTIRVSRDIRAHDLSARHPLRIALKKQRYAVQIFRTLYPKERRKPYMAAMAALQDAFGAVNDVATAQRLADAAAQGGGEETMRAAGFICGYHAARAEADAEKIDAAWAAFEATPPFWRD